jgi:hypothetical protein
MLKDVEREESTSNIERKDTLLLPTYFLLNLLNYAKAAYLTYPKALPIVIAPSPIGAAALCPYYY